MSSGSAAGLCCRSIKRFDPPDDSRRQGDRNGGWLMADGGWLKGKAVLITGAARRIGRATALAFADEGANVVVHYRSSADEAKGLVSELAAMGVQSWMVQADLSKLDETESLIGRVLDLAGSLDVVVNNASIFPNSTLETLTFDGLMDDMRVNAWSPFVLSREFARLVGMGRIVNLIDSRVKDYDWTHVGYILSKHVLWALTKMMALQYAPDITVNGVAPGLILPPPGKDENYLERLKDTVPLREVGDPRHVAEAIVYLAKSEYVTGEMIFVDGGRHLKQYLDPTKRP